MNTVDKGNWAAPVVPSSHWAGPVVLAALLLLCPGTQAEDHSFESPPTLPASDLVPREMLTGPHYRIDERVTTDGFLASFRIHSSFGEFTAVGPGALETRIREVEALAALGGLEQSQELKKGAQNATNKAAGRVAGNVAVNALGFDDARRRLAKQLGVDPYSTNPVLAAELDEVAWASFAGDLGIDILTAMIPGGAVLTTSTRLSNWVWDTPPGDLRVQIERSLLALGVHQEDVDLLLRHRWYPLSLQAALVLALDGLDGFAGRADLMPLALTVASEEQARYLVDTLRMTARYHETVETLPSLFVLGTVVAQTASGTLMVAAPADYLSWNQDIDRFSGREELAAQQRSMHLAGRLTERARGELEGRGWIIHESSSLLQPILPQAQPDT